MTPGAEFLAHNVTFLGIPLALAVTLRFSSPGIPGWLVASASIVSIPLFIAARIITKDSRERREAASLGARIAPRAEGKWIGNLDILRIMKNNWKVGYPGDGLGELIEKKGPVINIRVLWENIILTTSPEHIKIILATDFNNYEKGERFRRGMGSVLGTGVFNSDGDMWKFHRSITRPVFTRDRISHFELFDRHADTVITLMKQRMRAGHAVDFQDLMGRFTLDSASEFLLGSCVHSLTASLPYPHNVAFPPPQTQTTQAKAADEFARAFLNAQEAIANRERMGWIWPLLEIFKESTTDPMKVVNSFIEPIVRDAIEKKRLAGHEEEPKQVQEGEVGEDETLLDHLVNITSDPVVLRDETLNILLAGRDTTAATLTIVMYFLSMYPHVMTRLREEILAKVGPTRRPDYDDIREMKYLRAVINETLRLYPIVPFNTRESINATTWPSADPNEKPIYIPAGTKVPYSVFMMHRRVDLWGPDAEEFDPDRFLDYRVQKYLVPNAFIFLPFNAGPRICLGQQFAYNEMSFMLIRLLQSFSSSSLDIAAAPPESRPPKAWAGAKGRKGFEKFFPMVNLTLYTLGGLWVKMQEAEEL